MNIEIDDLKLLIKAADFAADKHRKDKRKGVDASPYINHPIALARILCDEGDVTDIEVICAALLHDTVEDTATTFGELESEFGMAIRKIVEEVTDDKSLEKLERKKLQVENAAKASNKARLVKLADKIANLRDLDNDPPADWDLQRRQEYFDWAKRVIDALRGTHPVLERLFDDASAKRPQ
jgi:guanosine-3',5'-bis(diphosphate) 3'-pyrophosphohydrolase